MSCVATEHGTRYAYYSKGCRCAEARADCARYQRERVRRSALGAPMSIPAAGTIRRLQALSRMGWTFRDIADRAGVGRKYVMSLATAQPPPRRVYSRFADPVDRAFRELCMTPGPSNRARANAAKHGWPPPLAWDNIDDPDEQPAGMPEPRGQRFTGVAAVWDDLRWQDVDWLRSYGVPDEQIAGRFGVTADALEKAERRHGRTAGAPAA